MFNKILCYVRNNEYSTKVLDALIGYDVRIIYQEKPWENSIYHELLGEDVLGINGGIRYIFPKDILDKHRILNLHPSFLPFNKGCHHSFWGIMTKSLLGATLHWMEDDIDGGDILVRKSFKDDGLMTAEEIQKRSESLCIELLKENIADIMAGKIKAWEQVNGTYHEKGDIIDASTLKVGDKVDVDTLFDLCRATCCKDNGFIIDNHGRMVKVVIKGIELNPNILPGGRK